MGIQYLCLRVDEESTGVVKTWPPCWLALRSIFNLSHLLYAAASLSLLLRVHRSMCTMHLQHKMQ